MTFPKIRLLARLGRQVRELLEADPFRGWPVVRSSPDYGLKKRLVYYKFSGRGVDLVCDEDERIRSIFVHRDGSDVLTEVDYNSQRSHILDLFGEPDRSGAASRFPGIGERGPWDRFIVENGVVHFQYCVGRDAINTITLMRHDVVP